MPVNRAQHFSMPFVCLDAKDTAKNKKKQKNEGEDARGITPPLHLHLPIHQAATHPPSPLTRLSNQHPSHTSSFA